MNAQLKAALISYARLFAGACLAAYIALGKTPFEVGGDDLKVIVSAGTAALVVVLANALNKKDERYGRGAPSAGTSGGDIATNVT